MEEINMGGGEELVIEIIASLLDNKFKRARFLADHDMNVGMLKMGLWDMVSKICELITEENACNPGFLDTCEHILLRLCHVCNVKELLLALLEQADRFKDDVRFTALLAPLQRCLLVLPTRRGHSVALVLDTLYAHVATLEKPEEQALEGQERKLLDSDPAVSRACRVLTPFLAFLEPLVEDAAWKNQDESVVKQRYELTKCLIKVFDHPIASLDLALSDRSGQDGAKPQSRILAEAMMNQLAILQCNFAKYLMWARTNIEDEKIRLERKEREKKERKNLDKEHIEGVEKEEEEEEPEEDNGEGAIPELGVSVFAYLIFSEQLGPDNIPQVMAHQYWLELNLPFLTCLLEGRQWLINEKGVALLGSIVGRIPAASLPADFFGTFRVKQLLQALLRLLCTGQNKELNQCALKHFTSLLWRFEPLGRYKFIMFMLKKSKHSGILGYCITQLKELIDHNLRMDIPDDHFCGIELTKLLHVVFTLPDCEKTDLMENSGQIMSALNLLRYLILRDKPTQNITGIWSVLPQIEKTYCENLRVGINMSRAHFQMDLEKLKKGKQIPEEPELGFTIGSEAVPGLTKEQKVQMLSVALHTFDMMESLLARISELTTQVQKPR